MYDVPQAETISRLTKRERLERDLKESRDKLNVLSRKEAVKKRKIRDRAKYVAGGIFIKYVAKQAMISQTTARSILERICFSAGVRLESIDDIDSLLFLINSEIEKRKKEPATGVPG